MTAPPPPAALERALRLVGDRWSLLVVAALAARPQRFADLQEALPGIATNVLAGRLRHLEGARIIVATPYRHRPPRFSYELTGAGRALLGPAEALAVWAAAQGLAAPDGGSDDDPAVWV